MNPEQQSLQPVSPETPDQPKRLLGAWVLRFGAFATLAVGVFLLGCYFVGPWLSRVHPAPAPMQTTVPALEPTTPPQASPSTNTQVRNDKPASDRTTEVTATVQPEPEQPPTIPSAPETSTPQPDATETPQAQASDTTQAEEATESPANPTPPIATSSLYCVRAGLFGDRTHADALTAEIKQSGFTASVKVHEVEGKSLYAVQVGAFRDRENANALKKQLGDSGFDATITTAP